MVYSTKRTLYFVVFWQGWGETVQHLHIYVSLCKRTPRYLTDSVPMLRTGTNPGLPAWQRIDLALNLSVLLK